MCDREAYVVAFFKFDLFLIIGDLLGAAISLNSEDEFSRMIFNTFGFYCFWLLLTLSNPIEGL